MELLRLLSFMKLGLRWFKYLKQMKFQMLLLGKYMILILLKMQHFACLAECSEGKMIFLENPWTFVAENVKQDLISAFEVFKMK